MAELEQLSARDRLVRNRAPQCLEVDSEPIRPPALRLDVRGDVVWIVASAHHVQRRSKRTGLDDRATSESPRQLLLPKAVEPRPERDVRRRRVLRLQRDEPLDGADRRESRALDEQLPSEQRAIQLAQGERLHVTTARTAQS